MSSKLNLPINITQIERFASGAAGVGLVVAGLVRAFPGLAMAAGGAAMIARGATGHSMLYAKLGIPAADAARSVIDEPIVLETEVHLSATREEVFEALTNAETAADIIERLSRVEDLGQGVSRLHFREGPLRFECDVTTSMEAPERISWLAIPHTDRSNAPSFSGELNLEPADEGRATAVRARMQFAATGPSGKFMAAVTRPFARRWLQAELRRLEAYLRGDLADAVGDKGVAVAA